MFLYLEVDDVPLLTANTEVDVFDVSVVIIVIFYAAVIVVVGSVFGASAAVGIVCRRSLLRLDGPVFSHRRCCRRHYN